VIKNLEVRNFCTGVALMLAYNNTIYNCSVHDNGVNDIRTHGIAISYSHHTTVDNCSVYNNTGNPVAEPVPGGNGIILVSSLSTNYCNITNNTVTNNSVYGIYLYATSKYCYIADNSVEDNGGSYGGFGRCGGIDLDWAGGSLGSHYATVENNIVSNNSGAGVNMYTDHNLIRHNVVAGNKNTTSPYLQGHGLFMGEDAEHNILHNNTFCGNEGTDICDGTYYSPNNNTGDDNTCDTTYNYNDSGTTGCTWKCVHHIVIRNAPNGGGSEVTAHEMTTADTLQVWCAGYVANGSFIKDVRCLWNATGTLDSIPTGPSTNVVFSPSSACTSGTITADDGSGHTDATGTITVIGALDHIIIRDTAGGEGVEVEDKVLAPNENLQLWAAGYDTENNYIADVSGDWETTGTLDYQTASDVSTFTFLPINAGATGTITVDNTTLSGSPDDTTGTIIVEDLIGCVGHDTGHVYQCGDSVTESCTFNGMMTCPPSSLPGLTVGADDIVIDGASFKITGDKGNSDCTIGRYIGGPGESNPVNHSGIFVEYPADNVTVKNLEIKEFCTGIAMYYGANHNIISCVIHDNGKSEDSGGYIMITHGIHLVGVNNCTITGNEIYNQSGSADMGDCGAGGNGISMFGGGWPAILGDYNNITYNHLHGNAKCGLHAKMKCMYNNINHNEAINNKVGIWLECKQSNYNAIEYNSASENVYYGICIGGRNNTIRYNTASNNEWYGISMARSDGSHNNELYENTVCGNGNADIDIYPGCYGNHGDNNTCDTTLNYNDTGTTGCTYDCSPVPDLTITEKYEEWIDQTNKTYNITYTVKNVGDANAGESTTAIGIDGAEVAVDPVPALAPDESYTATLAPFTMSVGNDAIRVCADKDNVVMEKSMEYNNCLENVFIHPVVPDLIITEKLEEWVDFENKTYNITYTIKNIGNADANESTTSIRIDGSEVATDPVPALAPDGTHPAELGPFTMSGDNDTIRICADNESVVEESNEDNNCKQNTFEHPGVPDLVITRKYEEWVVSAEPPCKEYNITYTVKNLGTGDADASTTSIIIDGAEVATDPVSALTEGETHTSSFGPFTVTGDSDTIKVCADENNMVDESNEDNNCLENVFEYTAIGCLAEDGTLFRCGNTVTKNCTFNGDMACPFTHGLGIGAGNITINGNNSLLNGAGCTLDAMSRSGIHNHGYDDVTIKELEVKGFCNGLYLYGGGNCIALRHTPQRQRKHHCGFVWNYDEIRIQQHDTEQHRASSNRRH
jgi:parallel beta-helix repeat protein